MTKVFISYSRHDIKAVTAVHQQLESHNLEVFMDYKKMTAGESFTDRLKNEIEACDYFLLFLSPHSTSDDAKWVKSEVDWAVKHRKIIIPIVIEPTEIGQFWFLSSREKVSLTGDNYQSGLNKLFHALNLPPVAAVSVVAQAKPRFHLKADLSPLTNHPEPINAFSFSADSSLLATAGRDGKVIIWDVRREDIYKSVTVTHHGQVVDVTFLNDNDSLAVATSGSTVLHKQLKLYSIADAAETATLVKQSALIKCVAFAPKKKLLAVTFVPSDLSLTLTSRVGVYKLNGLEYAHFSGYRAFVLDENRHAIECVAFSHSGDLIASDLGQNLLTIWDVNARREVSTFQSRKGHTDRILHCALSADDTRIATASADRTVKLWSVKDGSLVKTLHGHGDKVRFVDFSPNGKLIASASHDRTVKIWDTADFAEIVTLEAHSAPLSAVHFSPTGKLLASASQDGTVKLWAIT